MPNAIRVFNEVLQAARASDRSAASASTPATLTYLYEEGAQNARRGGLAGLRDRAASNSLDEYLIRDLLHAGRADATCSASASGSSPRSSEPVFGGVYKLAAVEGSRPGNIIPKIKISENVGKITNPHFKKLYRFYGNDTGKAIADYICLHDEVVDDSRDLEIFDPQATWKRKNIYNFTREGTARADLQKR